MAKTVIGTILDEAWDLNAGLEWGRAYGNAGHSSDGYYLFCLKFETPQFAGKSAAIRFGLCMQMLSTKNPVLRFALSTSSDNHKQYYEAGIGPAVDDNQLASGEQSFTLTADYATYTVELETEELQPNTTYYLFVWAGALNSLTRFASTIDHSATVVLKASGGVRITTSEVKNKLHAVIINTADSGWKRFVPIIWTGSAWKRQG